jgi:DNA recombination protein RmuC
MSLTMYIFVSTVIGGAIGYLIASLNSKGVASTAAAQLEAAKNLIGIKDSQLADLTIELNAERDRSSKLGINLATMTTTVEKERESFQKQISLLENAEEKFKTAFGALAAEALKGNSSEFLKLANEKMALYHEQASGDLRLRKQEVEQLVKPISQALLDFQKQVQQLETTREGAYAGISEQIKGLLGTQQDLRSETARLVTALRTPAQRGRWGEVQLKRVVELAGMLEYCDFKQQQSFDTEEGKVRPDLIVNLPGGRQIVVDSKVSLAAYLESLATEDESQRVQKLKEHAAQVKAHLSSLSSKTYWSQLERTPEFVVAFLPGEVFFSAALQNDPSLIEFGAEQRVILATPTTLIALLKAVAYGWRQEQLAKNASEINDLGKTLYERFSSLYEHLASLRRHLEGSVDSFNKMTNSLESRVMVTARKLRELGAAGGDEVQQIEPIEKVPRDLPESLRPQPEPPVETRVMRIAAAASEDNEFPTRR